MHLKLPPIVVFAIFAFAMYLLAIWLPVGSFEFFGQQALMFLLLFFAVIIAFWSIFLFFRASTTIDPLNPDKASFLVTGGIYRFSRNPMYLALLIVLLAWGLYLGNAFNTLLAAGFVYFMNAYQIRPEETALSKRFGKDFDAYCLEVRRWF